MSDIGRRIAPPNQAVSEGTEIFRWKPKPGKEFDVDVQVHVTFTIAFSEWRLDYVDLEDLWHYAFRPIEVMRSISEGRPTILNTTWPPVRTRRFARPWERRPHVGRIQCARPSNPGRGTQNREEASLHDVRKRTHLMGSTGGAERVPPGVHN